MNRSMVIFGIAWWLLTGCTGEAPNQRSMEDESSAAIEGGTTLTAAELRRSGVYWLSIPIPGTNLVGACTGAVLRTSWVRSETWVLTAAHCFGDPPNESWTATLRRNPGGGAFGNSDRVEIHPNFDSGGGRNSQDLALVRFPFAVAIETPTGESMLNWYRPLFGHDPSQLNSSHTRIQIFGMGCQDGSEPCSSNDGTLRYVADDYEGTSDENIEILDYDSSNEPHVGDSGGPWISVFGVSQPTTSALLTDGVIIGTHTGEYQNDDFAASSFGAANSSFFEDVADDSAVFINTNTWTRPCLHDWCHYRTAEQAALVISAVF